MPATARLSISGGGLTSDCLEVVSLLRNLRINGHVTFNKTVLDGRIENGCVALISSEPVSENALKVWRGAKATLALQCAHVEIEQRSSGCVFDVFRASLCPGIEE